MQLLPGQVVTEINALEMLFPVEVMQVAAGGVGKGKGSISLLIEGADTAVRAAFDLVSSLRNEREIKLKGNR
jgi:NAD(P)H-dependent flavin oxidoreductase YrpB (nitropropane dioxygenase family)